MHGQGKAQTGRSVNGFGWCPTCRERTVIEIGRPCAWCDTIVVKKRGGWKRPDRAQTSRISRVQALALHAAHCQGLSLREIARRTWQKLGYSSEGSCLGGIRAAFDREGLKPRAQTQATADANRKRRARRADESKNAYKRRRRREHGYRNSRTGEWKVAAPVSPHKENPSSDAISGCC